MEEHINKLVSLEGDLLKTLDFLLEGIQIIDFDWRYIYVNDTFAKQSKTSAKELIGYTLQEKYPGIEETNPFKAFQACMIERKPQRLENEYTYPDKSKRWFELNIEAIDEGIRILSLDITAHKEAEGKLIKVSNLYAFISQVNQNIVRVKDENTLFLNACNIAIEFGKFKMAWIGLFDKVSKRISVVDQSGIPAGDLKMFTNAPYEANDPQGHVLRSDTYYICNDIENELTLESWKPFAAKHKFCSCIILPIRKSGIIVGTFNLYATELNFTKKEEIKMLLEVTSDISFALDIFEKDEKRKLAELQLEHQNEELIKTNSELDHFVYSVSHDLRSPLTSVLGLLEFIEEESKETDTLVHAKMIRGSIKRLDNFIKNILSYSQNNRTELEVEYIPLQNVVTEIVDSLHNMKEAEGINFEIDIVEQNPFYSDLQRINAVLENLISNAIKYHKPEGSGRYIKVTGISDQDNLHLIIEDNGIGIATTHQSKIFEMFFRISGKIVGSGIGLYIVKETIEKLLGSIEVSSEIGTGTSFIIKIKNLMP